MSLESVIAAARLRDEQGLESAAAIFGQHYAKKKMSKQRVDAQMDNIRHLISFFREYPDIFIDTIKGPDCKFKFMHYQRQFLRAVMRHKYVYYTCPRGYSKSFLSMMALMIRCILFPQAHLFVTTAGKLIYLY